MVQLKMKKLFSCVAAVCAMLSLTSCPSDPDGPDDVGVELQASPTTLILNEQNTGTITVTSNTSWAVFSSASWLTVLPAEGTNSGTLMVSATSDNTGQAARTATVTISDKAGRKTVTITVTQNPPPVSYYLNVDKNVFDFQAAGGESNCTVSSNEGWSVTGTNDWCTATPTNGEEGATVVTINTQENTTISERSVTLLVTGKNSGSQQQIVVNQKGADPYLTVDKTTLSFDEGGGSDSFTISTNDEWSISGSASWCSLSSISGQNGTKTVTVTVNQNTSGSERSVTYVVKGKNSNVQREIIISQDAYSDPSVIGREGYGDDTDFSSFTLSVSQTPLAFPAAGGNKSVSITGNDTWTAKSDKAWCAVSPSSGSGSGTLTITVSKNTATSARTATVTVTGAHGSVFTISVSQDKAEDENSTIGREGYGDDVEPNSK